MPGFGFTRIKPPRSPTPTSPTGEVVYRLGFVVSRPPSGFSKRTSSILILTATGLEQSLLRESLSDTTTDTVGHRNRVVGNLGGKSITLLETGIGIANTAQALTEAILDSLPEFAIQIGVGGAYLTSSLKVGDLAIATTESYGHLGVITPDGWQSAEEIGIPLLRADQDYYNTFPLDSELASHAHKIIQREHPEFAVHSGPFVTVEQCSGLTSTGNQLAERFSAICENMEGAAAAHICKLYDLPFLEIRSISNLVENRDKEKWDLSGASTAAQSAAITLTNNWPLTTGR